MRILNCRDDEVMISKPMSSPLSSFHEDAWPLDLPWVPMNKASERKVVCVTSGHSLLGMHIVKKLLDRGYSVRVTVQTQQDVEEVRGGEGEEEMRMVESVMIANMGDMGSLCEAFEGCDAVFHTSSFIDPKGVTGYSERMALLEAKGAENVIEACGRVGSVKRCILSSSLLASVWQRSSVSGVLDESCWTDEEFCRENKLWLALGKTMAEKAAWRKSQEMNIKLVTVCHGLLTSPTFPSADDSSAIPYLKAGRVMLLRGVLATADVKKAAEAHVSIYEAMDQGACGRYLCFDKVVRDEDEAIRLEHRLKMHGLLSRRRNVLEAEEVVERAAMAAMQTDHLKHLRDIFARFDMDSDGSLTHLELAALLRSLGIKPTGDQMHSMLANMDTNGNGSVEFDELIDAILPEMTPESLVDQEQLMEVFRSFDRDGNGFITAAELAQSMSKMGHPLTFQELSEMFKEADSDGDGVISFTEFASVMAKSASDFFGLQLQ